MYYIYILLLTNNITLIVSSNVTINNIHNLPDFIEIKQIIKNEDKKELSVIFHKIIKESKTKLEILDNLDLDILLIVEEVYSASIESLEKEIEELNSIRQMMIKYENLILSTNIDLNNLLHGYPQYKVYSVSQLIDDKQKSTELEKLFKSIPPQNLYNYHRTIRDHSLNSDMTEQIEKYKTIEQYIKENNINDKVRCVTEIINRIYGYYCTENKVTCFEPDIILQLYTVKHYNNKLKKELKELIEKHGSVESIISKLTFTYSKILEFK
jgi:hypothetical protein